MVNVYLTQDEIGSKSGGGSVTKNEYEAFETFGKPDVTYPIDRLQVSPSGNPLIDDERYLAVIESIQNIKYAHIYAGCFTKTVKKLKEMGAKISYTCAAHSISDSKQEFESLGQKFDFPHLIDPNLWAQYNGGYLAADLVICPSTYSAQVMKEYGCQNIKVISHGVHLPESTIDISKKHFTVGYLGQSGPDKGLRYLFEAWQRVRLTDSILLIGGKQWEFAHEIWRVFGGGHVHFSGYLQNISDFYNNISLYVQPSATEGFGLEVLEAMAYSRPAVVSDGAGAVDLIKDGHNGFRFSKRDVNKLCELILLYKHNYEMGVTHGKQGREIAKNYTWDKIKQQYQETWAKL